MTEVYAIISINDLDNVDFSQVIETNQDTIRLSLDGLKFVLKWNDTPEFITDGSVVPLQILTHSECLELMDTSEWSNPIPPFE
jgi:hypothetical protein